MSGVVPHHREKPRRLIWLVQLLVLAQLAGCATVGGSNPGSAVDRLPPGMDEEALEGGAVAEAALMLTQVASIASGVSDVGARLSFTFWSEHGALTLTDYSDTRRPGPAAQPVDSEAFLEEVAKVLTRFAQRQTGLVELTLERQQTRWTVSYRAATTPRPSEAKTLPVRRAGLSAETLEAVTRGVERVLRAVEVPAGAQAQVDLECSLEDGRAEEWRLRLFEVTRKGTGGAPRSLAPAVRGETVSVLLPFTQGLGERTAHLRLRLWVPPGARQARGWVEAAEVERPAPSTTLDAGFVTEYRAMHEDILRRWREETQQGAEWVAQRGVEELALWYAGGIAVRGLGWLGGRVAPTVLRALQRNSQPVAGWLRTAVTRLSTEERLAFERLWTKVQLEGKGALSASERTELREVMVGLERLIHEPLDEQAKKRVRYQARNLYKASHPEFAALLDQQGVLLPIHHRRPLEYAHLFPEQDINAADNLAMVTQNVHKRIDALWSRFRRARPAAKAEDVEAVARVIDRQFEPWYHHTRELSQAPYSLATAEETALTRLQQLFPSLE